jgi:pentatricopeptide repeat protein
MNRIIHGASNKINQSDVLSVEILVYISQICKRKRDLVSATQLLEYVHNNGLGFNATIGNHLVPMLVECGNIASAQKVFDELIHKNVHSWTVLISGYIRFGYIQRALCLYVNMIESGVYPSSYTLVALLKACTNLKDVQIIYVEIAERSLEKDVFVGSTLIDTYCKFQGLIEAQTVFDNLPSRNVVSWTALISGYSDCGFSQQALHCYNQMVLQGLPSNDITLICTLKACGNLKNLEKGQEMHTDIVLKGFSKDLFIESALVDMYAKCGALPEAKEVFYNIPMQDAAAWNALIAGFVEYGPIHEALNCFDTMQENGIYRDEYTLIYGLKASGTIGAVDKGQNVHEEIVIKGFDVDIFIGNTLVDMYAKYGIMADGKNVFDKLQVRDVISWNAMIKGHSTNHEATLAIHYFECMQEEGVVPDAITFTCILSACKHAKFVNKGKLYFKLMTWKYGIVPSIDHFTCLVDLLGRAGDLDEAERFLETTVNPQSRDMWLALLSACKRCSEVQLGFRCFQRCIAIDQTCSTPYVLMASLYVMDGRHDDAHKIEKMWKCP